jgi:uncharacterized protein
MRVKNLNLNSVFLDTSYAIALASAHDQYHLPALNLAIGMMTQQTRIITTRAILLEIGNSLARPQLRERSIAMLTQLDSDSQITVVELSRELYQQAFVLYQSRLDKAWGIVDCISFVVMGEYQLTQALTADLHFQQAGFQPLLRN